jgi:hypothetical protein
MLLAPLRHYTVMSWRGDPLLLGKETTASLACSTVTSRSERELSVLVDNLTNKIVESTTSDKYDTLREEETGVPWNTVQR